MKKCEYRTLCNYVKNKTQATLRNFGVCCLVEANYMRLMVINIWELENSPMQKIT